MQRAQDAQELPLICLEQISTTNVARRARHKDVPSASRLASLKKCFVNQMIKGRFFERPILFLQFKCRLKNGGVILNYCVYHIES